MLELATTIVPLAALGWSILAYIFSGSFLLALLVFVVLKMMGR